MLKTIAQEWQTYYKAVLAPRDPESVEVLERRKTFYAGAFCLLMQCVEIGRPHVTEEEGTKHLHNLKDECEEYLVGIIAEGITGILGQAMADAKKRYFKDIAERN